MKFDENEIIDVRIRDSLMICVFLVIACPGIAFVVLIAEVIRRLFQ